MTDLPPLKTHVEPPRSREAEKCLLGAAMLVGPDQVIGLLTDSDFFERRHAFIWQAMVDCHNRGIGYDAVTVSELLCRQGHGDLIQSGAYLTGLSNDVPSTTNLKGWASLIKAHSQRRSLIVLGQDIADRALAGDDPESIVADLQTKAVDWDQRPGTGPRDLSQISASLLERMHVLESAEHHIETGLVDVDRRIIGMMPSELILIAGRPGMGKTASMQGILENVGTHRPVLCFSAEMSGEQILKRMIGTDIESSKLRDPRRMNAIDWQNLSRRMQEVRKKYKILIDDTGGINIDQLVARARRAKIRHNIALIAIDYAQLIESKAEGRTQEVALVSRKLKALAKTLDIPVVVLSQLNRGLEARPNKRPHMGDLRESGQLEQDADIIILLYRHCEYEEGFKSPVAEWIIAKHRDGQPGTELVIFEPEKTRFLNATEDAKREYREAIMRPATSTRSQSKFQSLTEGTA